MENNFMQGFNCTNRRNHNILINAHRELATCARTCSRLLSHAQSLWKHIRIIRGFHVYGDSWSPVIGEVQVSG